MTESSYRDSLCASTRSDMLVGEGMEDGEFSEAREAHIRSTVVESERNAVGSRLEPTLLKWASRAPQERRCD